MNLSLQDVEPVLDLRAELGEGPVWDPAAPCLYFVDVLRGHVYRFDPETGGQRTYEIGQSVGAVALTDAGDLLLAVRNGFARLDLASGMVTSIADVEADRPDQRMNDGKCDPQGRFWAGTMALDEHAGAGTLYCLGVDGRVRTMLTGVTVSNGLDWTADGRVMYFIDSPSQRIDRFDFDADAGAIANRRPFVHIPADLGAPDGLTLDADGYVWVALWGGGALHRYAPDGSLDTIVRMPTTYPTSCTFGGADLGDLYITTAAIRLSAADRAQQPGAGGLFRLRPGVSGRPPRRYQG